MTAPDGLTEQQVRDALNTVVDPCSAAIGVPAGINEMGLVRHVEVRPTRLLVQIAITDPGCVLGPSFVASARECLSVLAGSRSLDIVLSDWALWSEEDMSPEYRDRLESARSERRRQLPVVAVHRADPSRATAEVVRGGVEPA